MRTIFTIVLFQVGFVFGQTNDRITIISQRKTGVLLWNIENYLEFQASQDFDSTWLSSPDCDFIGLSTYSGNLIPRTLKLHYRVTVVGLVGNDTINEASFYYNLIRLPEPEIRLGPNFNLLSDLNNLDDSTLFFYRTLKVTYPHWLNSLLSNHDLRYMKVIHWEISVGNQSFFGNNGLLTEELFVEIVNSKIGTPILFEHFIVSMPDGREIEIIGDSEYLKKTSSGTRIPKYKRTIIEN